MSVQYGQPLSDREREVLALVRQGCTYNEIAGELGIAATTAKFHVTRIRLKTGLEHKRQLITWQERP